MEETERDSKCERLDMALLVWREGRREDNAQAGVQEACAQVPPTGNSMVLMVHALNTTHWSI